MIMYVCVYVFILFIKYLYVCISMMDFDKGLWGGGGTSRMGLRKGRKEALILGKEEWQ